jgi:hypothetical protein
MSFQELPIVDDNAKASEESVLTVRSFFSKKNGFISREEFPDYGSDLEVEMIIDSIEASGKKFPIQIKSSSAFKTIQVENQEYISKPFLTSRLNYLCQRPPAYGLIILYDDTNQSIYYDFAEQVVQRLMAERESQDWQSQKSVNIHIPKTNVITTESVASIHEKLRNRFQAHDILINQHGERFEIPSFSSATTGDATDTTRLSPLEILKKYGLLFMNQTDILFLYQLLSQISMHDTLASKDLIFIASVAYGEMGKCMEAEMYLNKAFQIIDQYEAHEQEVLRFIRIKVDFLLGKRNQEAFFADLKSMTAVTKNKFNALQLSINLLYYTVIQKIESKELDDTLEKDILEVFAAIANADIEEEKKMFLNVFHAENLHMFISSKMLQWISRLRVKEALKIYVSQAERTQIWVRTNELINTATIQVVNARTFAMKNKNKALQAHAEYALARFFLIREFDFFLLRFKEENPEKENNFKRFFLLAVRSHNLFLELGLLKDARLALICAYDLHQLAKLYHNLDISTTTVTDEVLTNNLAASQAEMGISVSYISIVDKAYQDYVKEQENEKEPAHFKGMSDEQITAFSQTVLESYGLPPERLVNIVNEAKAYRFFSTFGNISDFEVLADLRHYQSKETLYASPSSFILKSKRTGLESLPSRDLEKLARDFGALA